MVFLGGCNGKYCYKGHDESYIGTDGAYYVQFVCDEWRNSHFKYQNTGASDAVPK